MKNNYALVTGATSGIGYELAKLLAADGYNLVMSPEIRNSNGKYVNRQYGGLQNV